MESPLDCVLSVYTIYSPFCAVSHWTQDVNNHKKSITVAIMSWEAANAPKHSNGGGNDGFHSAASLSHHHLPIHQTYHPQHYGVSGDDAQRDARSMSSETVEAALSRLSKAYATSMQCIGSMNKTNQMILRHHPEVQVGGQSNMDEELNDQSSRQPDKISAAIGVVHRVANAARSTLERAILLDPLIIPHVPTLHQCMVEFTKNSSRQTESSSSRWEAVGERRPVPPTISSSAHKSTLIQLAYLSLVNYSDLLQSGRQDRSVSPSTRNSTTSATTQRTILDRGVVPELNSLRLTNNIDDRCCWKSESPEETQRLAVAALCDASNLDASDPTVWLKLACASRTLERIVAQRDGYTTVLRSKHRRLQRHALERGSTALPPHMPPNRTVLRALEEFVQEPEPEEYVSCPLKTIKAVTKTLELPRYSWSILGRMLIRACKGEDAASPWGISTAVTMQTDPSMFGLPMIVMELSPMLILPPRVLGKICQFLPNPSIWKFEATCRALSVSVMAARATMEESENTTGLQGLRQHDQLDQLDRRHEPSGKTREAKPSAESIAGDDQRVDQMNAANYRASSSSSGPLFEEQSSQCETRPIVSVHTRPTTARAEGYRTSQRLRSQQISSGKKQDREANRKSFTYCFLAATMACTKDQHDGMINALRGRKECSHLFDYAKKDTLPSASRDVGKSSSDSSSMFSTSRLEATERVSDASLPSFIDRWNAKNSGPMDVLERFLTHIAVYSEEVFLSDPGGTVGLASCIISSFEVLLLRSGSHRSLTPRFYKSVTETGSVERSIELFGMDLLYAELTLRHCDRYAPKVVEYDDDANLISILVPQLLEDCVDISRTNIAIHHKLQGPLSKFHSFQARCYWLAAGFFLCRSRFAKAAHDSREAEDEGIFFIEEAIRCFDVPNKRSIKVIKTPHLVSPGRQDGYWKEISPWSLAKFRDEIQASSVVSHARQQFQELVSQMEKPSGLGETQTTVSPQDAANLIRIGQKLFERYSSRYGDGNSKLHELIEDFLMLHGDYLLVPRKAVGSSQSTLDVESLSKLIPLEVLPITDLTTMLNPSILTMLVACLNMDLANRAPVAQLLLRLVLTAIDFHGSLLRQVIGSRESLSHVDGYNTDDVSSDTDDDSFMSDDVGRQPSSHKHDDEKKVRQCGHLVKLLVDRLVIIMGSDWHDNHKASLILSDEFRSMVKCTMDLSNRWFQSTVKFLSVPDDSVDQGIFLSIMKILEISKHVVAVPKSLEQLFFRGMVRTIISQRDILEALSNSQGDRASRNARQRLCIQRAKYLGQVASQIGIMLSTNLSTVNEDGVMRGALFSMESGQQRDAFIGTNLSCEEVTVFLHSVRWLQKYISQVDSETSASSAGNVRGTFDRPVIKELRIPISIMLVGLCGGASFSLAESTNEPMFSQGLDGNETLTLLDFFDSDASANDWEPEAKTDQEPHRTTKKDILRVICHAAHCIALVLERTEDKDIVTTCLENFCDPLLGGFLPLVSARVLNFFADTLLLNFGGDDSDGNPRKLLWAEEYSHRTEQIGQLVDTLLHKSYRWLYGFPLVSEHYHQQNPGKELAHASNPISEVAARRFKPQSTAAAAQLYRCVVRAYTGGRRTPPKAALELVASALPPQEESKRSRALREFVFAGDKNYFNLDDVIGLVNQRDGWEVSFSRVRNSILVNEEFSDEGNLCLEAREAMQVRRGLSSRLASGPLPIVSELGRHKETGVDDDRSHTIRQEEEISKKFTAVIDDLSLSDVDKCEGWYRAAQCLTMKADVIADRLGLNLGFSRIKDFSVPTHRFCRPLQLNIFDLESEQGKEEAVSSQIGFLGNDLSVYVSHSWSSFDSLRECAAKTRYPGSEYSRLFRETYSVSYQAVWKKIESQFEKSDYLGWCESWGGIFVNALRRMSLRFMCIALYILRSKESKNSMDKVLMSEISEALGVSIYSELMASQSYGWPMKTLTAKRKRDLSFAARACFESAIDLVENSSTDDDGSEERATWDLLFMVGKVRKRMFGDSS